MSNEPLLFICARTSAFLNKTTIPLHCIPKCSSNLKTSDKRMCKCHCVSVTDERVKLLLHNCGKTQRSFIKLLLCDASRLGVLKFLFHLLQRKKGNAQFPFFRRDLVAEPVSLSVVE